MRAAMTLDRGDVADFAVSVLIVVPAHEFSCSRACGAEVGEALGGELGAAISGAEQQLRVGVVIADAGHQYGGLTPSQYSIASAVVALSVEPLSPCSTGLIVMAAIPSASAAQRSKCAACTESPVACTS